MNTYPTITQKHPTNNHPQQIPTQYRKSFTLNGQTPPHHTGTVPPPTARRLSNLNHLHRLKPAEQPERHCAFCFRNSFPPYGTLLGAVLAASGAAISRDQVCDRLSSSIGVDRKQNSRLTPTATSTKDEISDRLNRPDYDYVERENPIPIGSSPFLFLTRIPLRRKTTR